LAGTLYGHEDVRQVETLSIEAGSFTIKYVLQSIINIYDPLRQELLDKRLKMDSK
jgi:hypothetical protein